MPSRTSRPVGSTRPYSMDDSYSDWQSSSRNTKSKPSRSTRRKTVRNTKPSQSVGFVDPYSEDTHEHSQTLQTLQKLSALNGNMDAVARSGGAGSMSLVIGILVAMMSSLAIARNWRSIHRAIDDARGKTMKVLGYRVEPPPLPIPPSTASKVLRWMDEKKWWLIPGAIILGAGGFAVPYRKDITAACLYGFKAAVAAPTAMGSRAYGFAKSLLFGRTRQPSAQPDPDLTPPS